jgi:hypothetical protein
MISRFSDQAANKLLTNARLDTLRSGRPLRWRRRLPRVN